MSLRRLIIIQKSEAAILILCSRYDSSQFESQFCFLLDFFWNVDRVIKVVNKFPNIIISLSNFWWFPFLIFCNKFSSNYKAQSYCHLV